MRPSKPSPMLAERRLDRRDVARAAALRRELSARPQDRREVAEQRVVIERSSGTSPSTGSRRPVAPSGSVGRGRRPRTPRGRSNGRAAPRPLDHRRASRRRRRRRPRGSRSTQPLRDPARAAAGVQHPLVAAELEPADARSRPTASSATAGGRTWRRPTRGSWTVRLSERQRSVVGRSRSSILDVGSSGHLGNAPRRMSARSPLPG